MHKPLTSEILQLVLQLTRTNCFVLERLVVVNSIVASFSRRGRLVGGNKFTMGLQITLFEFIIYIIIDHYYDLKCKMKQITANFRLSVVENFCQL